MVIAKPSSTMSTQEPFAFGTWLRSRREAAGLTQEALAELSGLQAKTIAALERGRRQRPYPHTIRALAAALGLDAKELEALLAAIAGSANEPPRTGRPEPEPAFAEARIPLIGRQEAVAELQEAVRRQDRKIVTITGPGGVGKTSLAFEVARMASDDFPEGVVIVPLESLDDPSLVLSSIAGRIGFSNLTRESVPAALHEYFRHRRVLLVLDNFEHLLEAAPDVAHLAAMNENLTVLVTSRAALRLRTEREYPLEPLAIPEMTRIPTPQEIGTSDAVQLFVERARASSRAFDLTRANAPAIAAICRRLDGLPLALELAAARLRVLSPTEILGRLDQSLPLLTGGARDLPERQRTMQQVIEWSYRLLAPHEQSAFRQLSVFSGGFDTEAALIIRGQESNTLDILSALVEHSLVIADPSEDGHTRYRMLETIRQFGNAELEAAGESIQARDAHLLWMVSLAERGSAEVEGTGQVLWLAYLEREHGNIRSALAWSLESNDAGRREQGLRIAGALWSFWYLRGHMVEGESWLKRALSAEYSRPTAARAKAKFGLGIFTTALGELSAAVALHESSLQDATQSGSIEVAALAHFGIADALRRGDDFDRAASHFLLAMEQFQRVGNTNWIGITQIGRAGVALRANEPVQAEELAGDALPQFLSSGDIRHSAEAEAITGRAAQLKGDFSTAARHLRTALASSTDLGDPYATLSIIAYLAWVAADSGRSEDAVRLAGAAAAAHLELLQHHVDLFYSSLETRIFNRARKELGIEVFERVFQEGHLISLDDAVAEALAPAEQMEVAKSP
jgi:predicted ATPase/DNA-binding XRE family transcriptional regulator